jgi:hypothetical protein
LMFVYTRLRTLRLPRGARPPQRSPLRSLSRPKESWRGAPIRSVYCICPCWRVCVVAGWGRGSKSVGSSGTSHLGQAREIRGVVALFRVRRALSVGRRRGARRGGLSQLAQARARGCVGGRGPARGGAGAWAGAWGGAAAGCQPHSAPLVLSLLSGRRTLWVERAGPTARPKLPPPAPPHPLPAAPPRAPPAPLRRPH